MHIPYVSREQITKLDELMVNHFKIPVVMMMENAGYRMAEFIRKEFASKKKILFCIGKGNNGGDGIAAARHLLNFGFSPTLSLITEELKKNEPKKHLEIAHVLGIPIFTSLERLPKEIEETDVIIDCLIGYNLQGAPRDSFAYAISAMNDSGKPIVACDVPSGVGDEEIFEPHVNATHILFLSLPKRGCQQLEARKFVCDIGVPAALYPMIQIEKKNYFEHMNIVSLDT
jgi:hydroxyethylthiazole kinase-like uncharacterized protein yjeF